MKPEGDVISGIQDPTDLDGLELRTARCAGPLSDPVADRERCIVGDDMSDQ